MPMSAMDSLSKIERQVVGCARCPRLVAWREESARHPPPRFRGERYWARPLPAFGDPGARILIVGLAPAANGGNRTGRMFTGDASGDFLFQALHAVGLANRPESIRRGDGLTLSGALVTAAVRCAPPDNRPSPEEFDLCREYIEREHRVLPEARTLVALGGLAFETCLAILSGAGEPVTRPRPRFEHGAAYVIGGHRLFATYHPSQQNTFTGRLTQAMLRAVLRRAIRASRGEPRARGQTADVSGSGRGPAPRSSRSRGQSPSRTPRAPDRPSK
jgi:uracil-DNA glycosylase family 4